MTVPAPMPGTTGALSLIRLLPRRALSRVTGHLAGLYLPTPLRRPLLGAYARAFGANVQEAEYALDRYESVQAFFTRRLRPGARPMPSDKAAIATPADGRVHTSGPIEEGLLLQAKGRSYDVADLIVDVEGRGEFLGGSYLTVHLAPGDYHRFHWPFDANVRVVRHVPGDLWPVHAMATASRPRLFARNERVIVRGHVAGGGAFALVAVGALNVGSIRLTEVPVRTNRGGTATVRTWTLEDRPVSRGREAGHFEMGSTIVLLLAEDGGRLDEFRPGHSVRVGEAAGTLKRGGDERGRDVRPRP